jgi:arylsulfatase A-like enzyme
MSRKILLITTDQMRHDALGCNGGVVARTPVIDALARNGINYKRAHNQNVVCIRRARRSSPASSCRRTVCG